MTQLLLESPVYCCLTCLHLGEPQVAPLPGSDGTLRCAHCNELLREPVTPVEAGFEPDPIR